MLFVDSLATAVDAKGAADGRSGGRREPRAAPAEQARPGFVGNLLQSMRQSSDLKLWNARQPRPSGLEGVSRRAWQRHSALLSAMVDETGR